MAANPASPTAGAPNPAAPVVGATPPLALDVDLPALEVEARRIIGEMPYAYYAGGAEDERLLAANRTAWSHFQLHPRVLAGVDGVDTSSTALGSPVRLPVLIAPTAIQGLAHREGETATARGAGAAGALMVLSSLATCALEDVAAAAPGAPRWMQVYILRDRPRTVDLVHRAEAAGYRALVLTVDVPVSGLRLRELRGGVHLPADLSLPNLAEASTAQAHAGGFMAVVTGEFEPALTPDDLGWLGSLTDMPVVAKGVQRADDAVRCVEAGAAAVIVSNHGGRQLDDAPATADILAEVVDAVAGRAEVYVDGGIRRAPDVVKALALGAQGVLVGRPQIWALATGGSGGVERLLDWFGSELARTMALCGAATVGDLDRALVRPAPPGGDVSTVAAMVAARADDDSPAVRDAGGEWTWRQAVAAGAARGALARELITSGPPHIGVLLPNGPEYLFWLNGAALAGAAVVGINPTRRGEALAADIRATDCRLIVTDAEGAALLEGLDLGLRPEAVLDVGTERYRQHLSRLDPGGAAARDLVAGAASVGEDSLFLLLFTSGTTGTPKAVRCTQGRLAGIAEVAAPGYGYTPDDVCYCPMPLFHGNALMALWGPAVYVGATIATRPRFSASAFLDDVRRFEATMFSYVGKAIAYILATPERPDDADNTLKSAFGTEASVRDRARFRRRFGCYLIEGYGQSEGGAAINPVPGMPKGALGKPVEGVDLAVLDPRTGAECPPARFDEDGRLLNAGEATGEMVNRGGRGKFEGYYENPEAESDRIRQGWYWTGDLAYVDGDGFFYFAGRRGDWLRVDSENFSAGPVEMVLSRHPDLAVVAVYPVPDWTAGAGDQVMAAVELAPGTEFDPAGFAAWVAGQPDMGTKWTPRFVRISASLPQTATGKVTKVGLRQEAWLGDDPVWWRPLEPTAGDPLYRLLTDEDRRALVAALAEHGRPDSPGPPP